MQLVEVFFFGLFNVVKNLFKPGEVHVLDQIFQNLE